MTPRDLGDALVTRVLKASDPADAVRAHWPADAPTGAHVLAVGKAAFAMARAAESCTPVSRGLAVGPPGLVADHGLGPAWTVLPADHPLPTARNLDAARAVGAFVASVPGDATLVALVSGGASAHLALPAEGVTLDDLRAVTGALQRAGAAIEELNAVRKHLERLKGGRLAAACPAATVRVLVLSDVPGDRLDSVSSGPFHPDPTTFADALRALTARGLLDVAPRAAARLRAGARGEQPDTPKPGDPCFDRVTHRVIASNAIAVRAAESALDELGFRVVESRTLVRGEAAEVGRTLAASLARLPADEPAAIVLGGETTVTVGDAPGRGGPSQELALAAALALPEACPAVVVTLSTDGIDGPTDAAGAVVTASLARDARRAGLDAAASLARHDSHALLDRLGLLIRTGPTGTNVNHVAVGVVGAPTRAAG